MKKDFKDFLTFVSNDKLNKISDEVITELNEKIPDDDTMESFIRFNRSYNAKMTFKILELYHDWNED